MIEDQEILVLTNKMNPTQKIVVYICTNILGKVLKGFCKTNSKIYTTWPRLNSTVPKYSEERPLIGFIKFEPVWVENIDDHLSAAQKPVGHVLAGICLITFKFNQSYIRQSLMCHMYLTLCVIIGHVGRGAVYLKIYFNNE